MRVRIIGSPEEARATVEVLVAAMEVLSVSSPRPARREPGSVRVYLEAAPRETGPATP